MKKSSYRTGPYNNISFMSSTWIKSFIYLKDDFIVGAFHRRKKKQQQQNKQKHNMKGQASQS